jgi:integrase
MLSIKYYLAQPFKDGVTKEDIKALKQAGKPITKYLNDQPTPIYLFLTFPGRKLVRVNSREKVKGIYWTGDGVKPQMWGSLELNDRLNFIKAEVVRQYRKAITNDPNINLTQVKALAESVVAGSVPDFNKKPMIDCLREFIQERESQVHELTTKKYNTVVNLLTDWMDKSDINPNQFFCDQIDDDFDYSFKNYLIARKNSTNTISKYLECIKKFMRWARKKKYHSTTAFEDFTVKRTRREIIWINNDELNLLIKYQPTDKFIKGTKLIYLFMIFTGQRFSDYRNLRRRNLIINTDGSVDWELFQQKGSKTTKTTVPLIQAAVEILDMLKFRAMDPDDFVLPIPCNQYFNRKIKTLGKLAGLNSPVTIVKVVGNKRIETHLKKYEVLSCHVSRKSWISLSAEKGLNVDYLTSVAGNTPKVLRQHYLGLNPEARRQAVNAAWSGVGGEKPGCDLSSQ